MLPHVPDAFVNGDIVDEKDGKVGKVGYEINFNRYFYVYKAPRHVSNSWPGPLAVLGWRRWQA